MQMSNEPPGQKRRQFLGVAAMTIAAGELVGMAPAGAQPAAAPSDAGNRGSPTPFGSLKQYRHEFAKLIWQTASPKWSFDGATFERSAASFDNPDHVVIPCTTTAGDSGSPRAKPARMNSKSASRRLRSSQSRPSRSKATRTARRIWTRAPTRRNSPAGMRTGSSRAASATTCRRKLRASSRRQSSTSTAGHRRKGACALLRRLRGQERRSAGRSPPDAPRGAVVQFSMPALRDTCLPPR